MKFISEAAVRNLVISSCLLLGTSHQVSASGDLADFSTGTESIGLDEKFDAISGATNWQRAQASAQQAEFEKIAKRHRDAATRKRNQAAQARLDAQSKRVAAEQNDPVEAINLEQLARDLETQAQEDDKRAEAAEKIAKTYEMTKDLNEAQSKTNRSNSEKLKTEEPSNTGATKLDQSDQSKIRSDSTQTNESAPANPQIVDLKESPNDAGRTEPATSADTRTAYDAQNLPVMGTDGGFDFTASEGWKPVEGHKGYYTNGKLVAFNDKHGQGYVTPNMNYPNSFAEGTAGTASEMKGLMQVGSDGKLNTWSGGGKLNSEGNWQHMFVDSKGQPSQVWNNGAGSNQTAGLTAFDSKTHAQFKEFGNGFNESYSTAEGLYRSQGRPPSIGIPRTATDFKLIDPISGNEYVQGGPGNPYLYGGTGEVIAAEFSDTGPSRTLATIPSSKSTSESNSTATNPVNSATMLGGIEQFTAAAKDAAVSYYNSLTNYFINLFK